MEWLFWEFLLAGIAANLIAHWLIGVYDEVRQERRRGAALKSPSPPMGERAGVRGR